MAYTPPALTVCRRGALLTPKEMEDLAECWQPYRSLGKPLSSLRPASQKR